MHTNLSPISARLAGSAHANLSLIRMYLACWKARTGGGGRQKGGGERVRYSQSGHISRYHTCLLPCAVLPWQSAMVRSWLQPPPASLAGPRAPSAARHTHRIAQRTLPQAFVFNQHASPFIPGMASVSSGCESLEGQQPAPTATGKLTWFRRAANTCKKTPVLQASQLTVPAPTGPRMPRQLSM